MLFFIRLVPLSLLLLAGCARTGLIGTRGSDGFTSASYPLHIASTSGAFDSRNWTLENVQRKGRPGELISKLGQAYERSVMFDTDGDGSYETAQRVWNDELSFRHRRSDARMSVSVLPMDQSMADTDMEVLVRNYVDAVSGGGTVSVHIGPGTSASTERRFATRILDAGVFTVAGEPAGGATFEVANVDQLELSKEARWERARVVLIRAPWQVVAGGQHTSTWPTLIRVLYVTRADSFESQVSDFNDLVKAIDFEGHRVAIDRQAKQIGACLDEPTDGVKLVLTVATDGDIGPVKLLKDGVQGQGRHGDFMEEQCVKKALKGTRVPRVPASFKVAWPIDRECKVVASSGVPAGTADFSAGIWPPHAPAATDKTGGGETAISADPLPAPAVAPSSVPPPAATEPAPMPVSPANSANP